MERQRGISSPVLRIGLNYYRKSETISQFGVADSRLLRAEFADNNFSPIKTRFPNLGGKDHRVVVLCPFSVVLIQLRLDPVLVRDYGLLTV